MQTVTRSRVALVLTHLAVAFAVLPGCGTATLPADGATAGENTVAPVSIDDGTMFATVGDAKHGSYELVAMAGEPGTGGYNFVITNDKSWPRSVLRFVWDFGSGPEGQGLQQSHTFTESGSYLVTVTAYRIDGGVAFVLMLPIDVQIETDQAPVAEAGTDQTVIEDDLVVLDASGSSDPDGDALTFRWAQISGPPVQLIDAGQPIASFMSPAVDQDVDLVFSVEVSDGQAVSSDQVSIQVLNAPDPCLVDSDGDGLNDCVDGCPDDPRKVTPGRCGCGVPDDDPKCGNDCMLSSPKWTNAPFARQSGSFEVQFDAVPGSAGMDGVVGLSYGPGASFNGFAALLRFNASGEIDARDGGAYNAVASIPYTPGVSYHFRLVVSVAAHTYSAFVTPEGGTERALAGNYAFRTEQAAVTSLDNLGAWASAGLLLEVCNIAVGGVAVPPLEANAGVDLTVYAGGSATLTGSASGGQAPYTFQWSPTTGLNSATLSSPTVTPTATTVYGLTVRDALGATATDTVTVTVQSPSLVVSAGPDQTIAAGGSVVLLGTASGGMSPYAYSWSPTAGLSSWTVAQPTASPSATTTYALTVRDSQGRTASDSTVVTVSPVTAGTTYYVAQTATNASDDNPGTSTQPWKTLAKAALTVRAGETVVVKAGVYGEMLRPLSSGANDSVIVFKAQPGDVVVIDGQGVRSAGVDLSRPCKYIRVEGFEIRNHTDSGVYLQAWGDRGVEGLEIVKNSIHHNVGDGIGARNSIKCLIEDNDIHDNGETAVAIGGLYGSDQLIIRRNKIHHNGKDGVQGASSNSIFEYNKMYDQFHTDKHQDGFDLLSARNVIIRCNTVYDFTQLIYFPLKDEANLYLDGAQIYGNILYTDRYWTVRGGEAPGIFIDARRSGAIVRNVDIHSNTFGWTGYGGIWIMSDGSGTGAGSVSGVRIRNNIFHESSIEVPATATELIFDYNMLYESTAKVASGPNTLFTDPMFVDYRRHEAWDFRLRAGSPAINAGADLGVFTDLNGTPRPSGGRLDLGALEFP